MGKSSTSFNPGWRLGKTAVIRVPAVLADKLLSIARTLDQSVPAAAEDMGDYYAGPLVNVPARLEPTRPINVSSVAKLSPFRYPGGKTWLIPYVRTWLLSRKPTPARFVEPFAGGGIVSLTVAFEDLAKQVVLAELDENVGAVWRVMLNGHANWLANRILNFELTHENVHLAFAAKPRAVHEIAFQTILRNRVQRGGIMAPGAGIVKSGENGKGLASRWYPQTLAQRIRAINARKHKLNFIQGDGFKLIDEFRSDEETIFFIDPPYTGAARRLYLHWEINHRDLFVKLSKVRGDFLMTYDNTPEVAALAQEFGFDARPVAMKNTHHAKMTELLIGRNLGWLTPAESSPISLAINSRR